jgi:flagellar FliJ protein
MRWTRSLIRISEHEIEDLRRRLAHVVARRTACEVELIRLAEEGAMEARRAAGDAEAGWYMIGFREGQKVRKARVQEILAAVIQEEQGARDALAKAFEALKKVEHVAEAARVAEVKAEARRETAALDELGARRNRSR